MADPKGFRLTYIPSCAECDDNHSTEARKVYCVKNEYTFIVPKARDTELFVCDDFKAKVKDKPKVKEV